MFEWVPFVFCKKNGMVHHFELLQQDAYISYYGHLGDNLTFNYEVRVLDLESFQKIFCQKNVCRFLGEFTSEINPVQKASSDRMIVEPMKLEFLLFGKPMEF